MQLVFLEVVQDFGGAQKATCDLAARLALKHNVLLLDTYGTCKPFLAAAKEKNLAVKVLDKRSKPFIISVKSVFKKYWNRICFVIHLLKMNKRINSVLSEFGADFLIVNNAKALSFSLLRPSACRVIFYAHGWYVKGQMSVIDRWLYGKAVDRFICISEATKQALFCSEIKKLDEMYVVHNAIDEANLSSDVALSHLPPKFTILHAGGFLPSKGQHISIEIIRKLKAFKIPVRLILAGIIYQGAGSESYFKEIQTRIREYNCEEEVCIVSNPSGVIDCFRACNLLIHPSSTEGLPLVLLEAMILKKPVIANAVGGVTDCIIDGFTGFLPNHNSIDEYVECILKLYNDEELYERIAWNAYSLAKESFTAQKQLRDFEKVIKK